jgi:hypothetical protein
MKELHTFFPIRRWKSLDGKKSDWELLGLQAKVSSIREETVSLVTSKVASKETYFNCDGFIKNQVYDGQYWVNFNYDASNIPLNVNVYVKEELQKKLVFHYDILKNELQVQCLNTNGNCLKSSYYTYNTANLIMEENHIRAKDKITIKYTYDKWNRIVLQEEYYCDNLEAFQKYYYHATHHFIRENYNWKHELTTIEVHQQHNNQKSKSVVIYNTKKNIIAHFNFEYDSFGNLLKKERVEDVVNKKRITHRYEYDSENNWTQCYTICNAEITEITKRVFKY